MEWQPAPGKEIRMMTKERLKLRIQGLKSITPGHCCLVDPHRYAGE